MRFFLSTGPKYASKTWAIWEIIRHFIEPGYQTQFL
jgi:hypothetical protein